MYYLGINVVTGKIEEGIYMSNIKKKRIIFSIVFAVTLSTTILSIFQFGALRKSSASVYTNLDSIDSSTGLAPVYYNGENMYVAKSSFYDYRADCQVGESDVPKEITDGVNYNRNTMNMFNLKLVEVMKYGNKDESPAKYPLYQGRFGRNFADATLFNHSKNEVNEKNNFWLGANNNQIGSVATQGLVDSVLRVDDKGETHITHSNPDNGKSADLPYFNKELLTKTTFNDSKLSIGSVKENVSFPFRKYTDSKDIVYYEYDSLKDTVRFNSSGQLDYFGPEDKDQRTLDPYGNGGFFPFNKKEDRRGYAYPLFMSSDHISLST
jgi:hypothetical protein